MVVFPLLGAPRRSDIWLLKAPASRRQFFFFLNAAQIETWNRNWPRLATMSRRWRSVFHHILTLVAILVATVNAIVWALGLSMVEWIVRTWMLGRERVGISTKAADSSMRFLIASIVFFYLWRRFVPAVVLSARNHAAIMWYQYVEIIRFVLLFQFLLFNFLFWSRASIFLLF